MIKISYFYKVRFFSPNEIPISTAIFDPKWFHLNRDQSYTYRDKRGVINGLRAPIFAPGPRCEGLCHGPEGCKNSPENCDFLQMYHVQLKHLNFKDTVETLEKLAKLMGGDTAVLLVHEAPTNPCSEREVLKLWFKENNYELEEY